MKKIFYICLLLVSTVTVQSCLNDLDTEPIVELTLDELLAQDPDAIEGITSRLYASFALSGPDGPGSSDISDDAGESPFLRGIVNLQDFTADAMKNRWGEANRKIPLVFLPSLGEFRSPGEKPENSNF